MDPRLDTYDWREIFEGPNGLYTDPVHVRTKLSRGENYTRAEVAEVIALEDGENNGAEWVGLFRMTDGKFMCVRAGCDYTGWGCCRAGGSSDYGDTLDDVVTFGLTEAERTRLNLRVIAIPGG